MDGASELDVQLARYDATKVARRSGKCTIIEHGEHLYGVRGVEGNTIEWCLTLNEASLLMPKSIADLLGLPCE